MLVAAVALSFAVPVTWHARHASTATSLTTPLRAAFYYPWFSPSWTQSGTFPYTKDTPTLGYYDQRDLNVIRQHIKAMQYGNISAGIASWWGLGHYTDARVPDLLTASAGTPFQWGLYYEQESLGDPSVAQITSDLTYIRDNYASSPNYLHINGKFVVFVYSSGDTCPMADRWKLANTVNAYVVLKVFSGHLLCASQPDGWHQYSPSVAADSQGADSYSISPGFDHMGEPTPRLARDLTRWRQNIRDMVASGAALQLVTTFNEWGEGTAVESANQWASASGYGAFVDALHDNGAVIVPPAPTPAPTAIGGDPVALAAGDIASCSSSGDDATATLLLSMQGTVLTLGDNAYQSGTSVEFANCYQPSWGQVLARTKPAPGNHEYLTTGATGYYGYFGAVAGDPTKGYYSYDLGTWHIVVINAECQYVGGCSAGSPQEQWLRADLAAHPATCTAAYWHQARFSSGSAHGSHAAFSPIWQALYDAGADVVLSGHDHDYERFAPQDAAGVADPLRGIREFVAGTGGASHELLSTPVANSEVSNDTTFGVLKLTLHASSYDWQFAPVPGGTFTDSGSASCHDNATLDGDRDGMPDVYELAHACLNSLVPDATGDPDSDNVSSLQERQLGSDPCAAGPASVGGIAEQTAVVAVPSASGRDYLAYILVAAAAFLGAVGAAGWRKRRGDTGLT